MLLLQNEKERNFKTLVSFLRSLWGGGGGGTENHVIFFANKFDDLQSWLCFSSLTATEQPSIAQ